MYLFTASTAGATSVPTLVKDSTASRQLVRLLVRDGARVSTILRAEAPQPSRQGFNGPTGRDRSTGQPDKRNSDTSITPVCSQKLMVEVATGVGCVSQGSGTSHSLDQQAGQLDAHVELKTNRRALRLHEDPAM